MDEIQVLKSGINYVLNSARVNHFSDDIQAFMFSTATAAARADRSVEEMDENLVIALDRLNDQIERLFMDSASGYYARLAIKEIIDGL